MTQPRFTPNDNVSAAIRDAEMLLSESPMPQDDTPSSNRAIAVSLVVVLAILVLGLVAAAVALVQNTQLSKSDIAGYAEATPGEVRTLDLGAGVTLEVVWIPAGSFLMGTPTSLDPAPFGAEAKPLDAEIPQHNVVVSRGFWMARNEITNAQYRRFQPTHSSGTYREFSLDGDTQPVVRVSWENASAFCNWLAVETGLAIRLPSEAEWEYACRTGKPTAYAEGDALESLQGFANAMNPSVAETLKLDWTPFPWEDGSIVTAAVGQHKPNAWGLYDMHGNVWEWCNDWFDSAYYTRSPETDPKGPASGSARVLRGGSWSDTPWYCRSAFRIARAPGASRVYDGFRIAISAPVESQLARR